MRSIADTYTFSDSGYWTPSTTSTVWWTPSPTTTQYYAPATTQYYTPTTTSYWSTWTPTSTYTTCYTQQNVVVTVTSYLPCPETSTVVYWECCDQCQNNCNNPPSTTYYGGQAGTTTVTSYTTTTPGPEVVQTITSNGLVIVMVSSSAVPQSATPSIVYQVSNDATPMQEGVVSSLCSTGTLLAAIATVMVLL